eukprot:9631000-Lingulodinium_polyedra.AAC.1
MASSSPGSSFSNLCPASPAAKEYARSLRTAVLGNHTSMGWYNSRRSAQIFTAFVHLSETCRKGLGT